MAVPTVDARVDWDNNGFGSSGIDVITPDVLSITVDQDPIEFGAANTPCRATIRVKNDDGKYSDLNASSVLFGKLKPNRPIGIKATYSAVPYGIFDGYIREIVPVNDVDDPYADLICYDPLSKWSRTRISVGQGARTHGELRAAVLDEIGGITTAMRDLTTAEWDELPYTRFSNLSADEALGRINEATLTRHYVRSATTFTDRFVYVARDRNYKLEAGVDASLTAGTDFERVEEWQGTAGIVVNEQVVNGRMLGFGGFETVWDHAISAGALPFRVPASSTVVVWAEWDTPAADGVLVVSGGLASATMIFFGTSAKISLTAGVSAVDVSALSISARPGTETTIRAQTTDAGSQATYDASVGSAIDSELIATVPYAQGIADHLVWRFKDARRRARVLYENRFPQILARQPLDVLSLTDPALSMTSWRGEIIGYSLTIDVAGERWTLRHTVQEAPEQTPTALFTLGTDALGGAAILAR